MTQYQELVKSGTIKPVANVGRNKKNDRYSTPSLEKTRENYHRITNVEDKDNQLDVDFELYNLAEDPNEQGDLVHQYPELAKSMREALEAWLASVVRSLNGHDYC